MTKRKEGRSERISSLESEIKELANLQLDCGAGLVELRELRANEETSLGWCEYVEENLGLSPGWATRMGKAAVLKKHFEKLEMDEIPRSATQFYQLSVLARFKNFQAKEEELDKAVQAWRRCVEENLTTSRAIGRIVREIRFRDKVMSPSEADTGESNLPEVPPGANMRIDDPNGSDATNYPDLNRGLEVLSELRPKLDAEDQEKLDFLAEILRRLARLDSDERRVQEAAA